MASEGRYEIEAAKQRLAAAKAQSASATKTLELARAAEEAAKKTREGAESQHQSTQKELEEAKTFLAEREKRWEVIDVDAASESPKNDRKRRKVSLSPGTNDGVANDTSNAANNNRSVSRTLRTVGSGAFATRAYTGVAFANTGGTRAARAGQGAEGNSSSVDNSSDIAGGQVQISPSTINICRGGTTEVNGTYTKSGSRSDGTPRYTKTGEYEGGRAVFSLHCTNSRTLGRYWVISCRYGRSSNIVKPLYEAPAGGGDIPPKNGWKVFPGSGAGSCTPVLIW